MVRELRKTVGFLNSNHNKLRAREKKKFSRKREFFFGSINNTKLENQFIITACKRSSEVINSLDD